MVIFGAFHNEMLSYVFGGQSAAGVLEASLQKKMCAFVEAHRNCVRCVQAILFTTCQLQARSQGTGGQGHQKLQNVAWCPPETISYLVLFASFLLSILLSLKKIKTLWIGIESSNCN